MRHSPTNSGGIQLNKKIDGAIGLSLIPFETDALTNASYNDASSSINPVLGEFMNYTPFFVHIEIKRPHTTKVPLVQLGVWAAAEFSKREFEGYALDMPIVSISIVGDIWELWVSYPEGVNEEDDTETYGPCVLMGPVKIGDTMGTSGVFSILHFLCLCADWGLKEYRTWFDKEILKRYKGEAKEKKGKAKE